MIAQIMITKMSKPIAVVVATYFFQSANQGQGFVDKALEYGLAVGIMALVIVMLYKEYKTSQSYNKERDERLEELLANNTEAYRDMKGAIDNLADEQKQFRSELKYIHRRVDTNRELIEKHVDS